MTRSTPQPRVLQVARSLLEVAGQQGTRLALMGSVAVRHLCPTQSARLIPKARVYGDIDFAGRRSETGAIRALFENRGWQEDARMALQTDDCRLNFLLPNEKIHADLFLDRLDACHVLDLTGSLDSTASTLLPSDLLLTKLQWEGMPQAHLNEVVVMLLELVVVTDPDAADQDKIVAQCLAVAASRSWGLWHSVSRNLVHVREVASKDKRLKKEERRLVMKRIELLGKAMDEVPKTARWQLRRRIGPRIRWYRRVETPLGW